MSLSWLHPGVFYSGAPNSDYNRGIGNLQKIKIRSDFYGQGVRPGKHNLKVFGSNAHITSNHLEFRNIAKCSI